MRGGHGGSMRPETEPTSTGTLDARSCQPTLVLLHNVGDHI